MIRSDGKMFTRSVSLQRDSSPARECKVRVFVQLSIDSGIAEDPFRTLDSKDDMSEDKEFKDAVDFDE